MTKIDCQWNDLYRYCLNDKVKRSWFGIGPRKCIEFANGNPCEFKESWPRSPNRPSPSPKPKINSAKDPTEVYNNYDIISDPSINNLISKVNTFIRHGYILLDGPFFAQDQYHQAIIRKANKEKSYGKKIH